MSARIDFDGINRAALAAYPGLLHDWFPAGRLHGHEFVLGDLQGSPGRSLSINIRTGAWGDFASDAKGGDPISLAAAAFHGGDRVAAAKDLGRRLGVYANGETAATPAPAGDTTKRETLELRRCPEQDPPRHRFKHWKHGEPSGVWLYRDQAGDLLCVVARYDLTNQDGTPALKDGRREKEFFPWTYGRRTWTDQKGRERESTAWHCKAPPTPRPLYGLDRLTARPEAPVLVCEGEKAADAAGRLFPDHVAIAAMNGAKAPTKADWTPLRGRAVTVWPDQDEPGAGFAATVAEFARRAEASAVRTVEVPATWPEGWDLADALPDGVTPQRLREMLEAAPEAKPLELGKASSDRQDANRPTITVRDGFIDQLATAGEAAIIKAGLPVFQRGESLVRPVSREVPAARGRMTTAAALAPMARPAMVDTLAQAARWERWAGEKKGMVRTDPPSGVADILLSRVGHWSVPAVAGIITTPTMRTDGSILLVPGFDPATRLYHVADRSLRLPAMAEKPNKREAEAALKVLTDLLTGFPFVDEVAKAVALSALLTPMIRGAISVAPMHAFRASTAGTGKSYLTDVAAAIATGRLCPVVSAGRDEAETEKRLVGLLLAGFPIVSLDNINGTLGGDLLCQAVERPLIRLRALGSSKIEEIESRATFFATGNNLRVHGDMVRRALIATLEANMERPELRTFAFDPVARVLADRGRYVAAAMTIVRAYLAAGEPSPPSPVASYEDWNRLVRAPLIWLGCADPVASMEVAREEDPDLAELREVIAAWFTVLPPEPGKGPTARTLQEVVKVANAHEMTPMGVSPDLAHPDFLDVLTRLAGDRGGINTKRLGKWLADKAGRIVACSFETSDPARPNTKRLRFFRGRDARGGIATWGVEIAP